MDSISDMSVMEAWETQFLGGWDDGPPLLGKEGGRGAGLGVPRLRAGGEGREGRGKGREEGQ